MMMMMMMMESNNTKISLIAIAFGIGIGWLVSKRWKQETRKRNLIGVIGGLGPKATSFFYDENILNARIKLFQAMYQVLGSNSQFGYGDLERTRKEVMKVSTANWTEAELKWVWDNRVGTDKLRDQDHVDLLIYTHPTIPGRPEFMSGVSKFDPTKDMQDTAETLVDAGASVLCMVCSTAHYFKKGMLANVPSHVKFLDMIDITFDYIVRNLNATGRITAGLMGTEPLLKYQVYENALKDRNDLEMDIVTSVSHGCQDNFTEAIFGEYGIKAGYDTHVGNCPHTKRNFELLLTEVLKLYKHGAKAIILGCTELPLLLTMDNISKYGADLLKEHHVSSKDAAEILLVNPAQILGDELIHHFLINRTREYYI